MPIVLGAHLSSIKVLGMVRPSDTNVHPGFGGTLMRTLSAQTLPELLPLMTALCTMLLATLTTKRRLAALLQD